MDKQQFFYRCVAFTRSNNKIALADIYNLNQTSELEDWMGTVISLADGLHTIQELIDYLGNHYDNPPENLVATLESVFERLIEGEMIKLHPTKVTLPYYLASPVEELDIEKAKELMVKDGYVYH